MPLQKLGARYRYGPSKGGRSQNALILACVLISASISPPFVLDDALIQCPLILSFDSTMQHYLITKYEVPHVREPVRAKYVFWVTKTPF